MKKILGAEWQRVSVRKFGHGFCMRWWTHAWNTLFAWPGKIITHGLHLSLEKHIFFVQIARMLYIKRVPPLSWKWNDKVKERHKLKVMVNTVSFETRFKITRFGEKLCNSKIKRENYYIDFSIDSVCMCVCVFNSLRYSNNSLITTKY